MLCELAGKRISVVVPKKDIVRVKKVVKDGPRSTAKAAWYIDFRGIRSGNCVKRRAVKNKPRYSGEKAAFNSPKRLQKAVDDYFESCYDFMYDKNGNLKYNKDGEPIKYQKSPFTVSGLAYSIGIATQTFNRYCQGGFDSDMEKDPNLGTYKDILRKSRQKIESFAESNLYSKDGSFGAKFVLDAAFGWCTQREKAEIEEKKFNNWLKKQEFDLKKKLLEMGEDTSGLEIRIVRKDD